MATIGDIHLPTKLELSVTRSRRIVVAMVVAAAAVVMTACSSSTSTAPTTTTSTPSNKSFEVATADGQASLSLDGQLPPGWPKAFPLPDGSTPAGSGSLVKSSSGGSVAVFTTPEKPQTAYEFYRDNPDLVIESSSAVGVGPAYIATVKVGGAYAGVVTVISKSETTYIVIVLEAGTAVSDPGMSTDTIRSPS
ncbi:MAG: hypothetical protein WCK41_04465 [Actinomycetes bacterium]